MKRTISIAVLAIGLTGCSGSSSGPSAQQSGQSQTETAFKQQSAAVPYPVTALTDSTERRNLRERLLRFNKPNRLGYVYIFNFGKVIGYYTIEGKISNPDSQMTTQQLIQSGDCNGGCAVTVTAPGDDGSYGANERGIFFFTTEGALVETSNDYLYSDQPIATYASLPKLNGSSTVSDLSQRK
ncbi:MAG: hypothetical protein NVS3B1_06230 [Marmoricola sp.]